MTNFFIFKRAKRFDTMQFELVLFSKHGALTRKDGGYLRSEPEFETIVNTGEWLRNSTKFFVACSHILALTVHKTQ